MLPKHYQYQYDSENLSWASVALFLPVVVNLTPLLNQKGPPLGWKIRKNVKLLILIALNKGFDKLNATQKKPHLSGKYHFWKKQENWAKTVIFDNFDNFLPFWPVYLDFSWTVLCRELRFLALHSVRQNPSFKLSKSSFRQFFRFFTLRGDPFDLGGGGVKVTTTGRKRATEAQ